MSLILAGRIVPLSRDPAVAPTESASFRGRVYVGDDGRIAAIRRSRQTAPPGFGNAVTIDVGTSLIVPGLDRHAQSPGLRTVTALGGGRAHTTFRPPQHLAGATRYAAEVTWPAYAYIVAAPEELLAYAEVRALIGGTTSIQGSPPSNRPLDGWLIRNIEDETLGGTLDGTPRARLDPDAEGRRPSAPRRPDDAPAPTFIYHCAEGQRGSIVAREFEAARMAGCLQPQLRRDPHQRARPAGYAAGLPSPAPSCGRRSPTCGSTARPSTSTTVRAHGITLCLGSDWGPSGTRNVLGELKVAAVVSRRNEVAGSRTFELVKWSPRTRATC